MGHSPTRSDNRHQRGGNLKKFGNHSDNSSHYHRGAWEVPKSLAKKKKKKKKKKNGRI